MTSQMSRADLIAAVERIVSMKDEEKWDVPESLYQPSGAVDGNPASGVVTSIIDSCAVDIDSQAVAARIIKTEEYSSTEKCQYQEILLVWFVDGRLSSLKTLRDNDARRAKRASEDVTPSHLQKSNPTTVDLKATYRNYIRSINDHTMEDSFGHFCKPCVLHNTVKKTIAEYVSLIQESQSAIQGLHFEIEDLIIDNDVGRVAARLEFTGTPVKRWADAMPTGGSVKFHEHVMYWLDKGKIHWVWSIVDLDTYRDQLQS
ncbi:hypothetical protein ACHAPU_006039 [Fusarium lateritium]